MLRALARRLLGTLGLPAAGLLAGCAAVPAPAPPRVEILPPESVEPLVRRWEAEWRAFPGLRAAVDLDVRRNGRSNRTAGVLVLSPTQLRFEAVTPLGLPALIVVAAPERLTVFSPLERRAWTGRPTLPAMARWLGLPVDPDALIQFLVGRAPVPPESGALQVVLTPSPHLAFQRNGGSYRVWVGAAGHPLRVQVEDGGRVTVAFERGVDGALQSLTVEVPTRAFRAQLRYLWAEFVAPPPDVFELVIPPGVPIEPIESVG